MCNECGAFISSEKEICPNCGSTFEEDHSEEYERTDDKDFEDAKITNFNTGVDRALSSDKFKICESCGGIYSIDIDECPICDSSDFIDLDDMSLDIDKKEELKEVDEKIELDMCTVCGHFISKDSKRCPICGSTKSTTPDIDLEEVSKEEIEGSKLFICDACGAFVTKDQERCPICGSDLEKARVGIDDYEKEDTTSDIHEGIIYSLIDVEEERSYKRCKVCGAVAKLGVEKCPICSATDFEEHKDRKDMPIDEKSGPTEIRDDKFSNPLDDLEEKVEGLPSEEDVKESSPCDVLEEEESDIENISDGLKIIEDIESIIGEGSVYHNSNEDKYQGEVSELKGHQKESDDFLPEERRKKEIIKVLTAIGNIYVKIDRPSLALDRLEVALDLMKEIKDDHFVSYMDAEIAKINYMIGNYDKSLEMYQDALDIITDDDKKIRSAIMNNIGSIYKEIGDYKSALNWYIRALKIDHEILNKKGISVRLNNIGVIHQLLGHREIALKRIKQALMIEGQNIDSDTIVRRLNNIASLYYHMDEYKKAILYYANLFKITVDSGNKIDSAVLLRKIGRIFNNLGMDKDAIFCYKKTLDILSRPK